LVGWSLGKGYASAHDQRGGYQSQAAHQNLLMILNAPMAGAFPPYVETLLPADNDPEIQNLLNTLIPGSASASQALALSITQS
jgi:hypothetical protein